MDVEFADESLRLLATNPEETMGLPKHVAQKYRDRIAYARAAPDERALYALRGSLDYKKVKGSTSGEKQMRLNRQYRIRLTTHQSEHGGTVIRIVGVGDFHDS